MSRIGRCLALLLLITGSWTGSVSAEVEAKPLIMVVGNGKAVRPPDVAYITLYVTGNGILTVDAAKDAAEKLKKILDALQELKIADAKIETMELGIGEKEDRSWSPDKKEEPPRPQFTHRIRITIPPADKPIHELLDAGLRAGALFQIPSQVHYSGEFKTVVVYGLLNFAEAEKAARAEAIGKARAEAEQKAELLGGSLGPVSSSVCAGAGFPQNFYGWGAQHQQFPTEYISTNPAEVEVRVAETLNFEFKNP